MSGWVTGTPRAGAFSPTDLCRKLGSIFASVAASSGGNSTTRNLVPLSGGEMPIGRAAGSSLVKESAGGEASVVHMLGEAGDDPADVGSHGGGAGERQRGGRPERHL